MMHDKVSVLLQSANIPQTQRRTCEWSWACIAQARQRLRVCSIPGCDLPKTLIGANKSNETGHWESEAIARFNDRLLASAGSTWDDWLAFNPGWFSSPKALQFHEEALGVLDEEFGNSRFFVLKDPRICRLAPFWMNVLAAQGAVPRILLPVRNPMEVARSLAARNGFEPALGQLLWLRHVLEAEHATRGRSRFFTSYDGFLKNWASITVEASEVLEVSWPCQPARIEANVATFLDKKYRHHEEAVTDTIGNPNLSSWLRDAFRVFADWSASGEKPEDVALLDRIRTEFDIAAPAFAGLVASGRNAIQRSAKLQTEQKALTDAIQVGERTIAELRTKLGNAEKGATARSEKLRELEVAVDSTRQKLVAAEAVATTISAERNLLKDAARIAEGTRLATLSKLQADQEALTKGLRTKTEEAQKRADEQTVKVRELDSAINSIRQELAAQQATVVTVSAERNLLKDAARIAEGTRLATLSKLQADQEALTKGLRTKTEEAEKRAAEQTVKVRELDSAINSIRQELAAQQATVVTVSAERNSLKNAVRIAEETRLATLSKPEPNRKC